MKRQTKTFHTASSIGAGLSSLRRLPLALALVTALVALSPAAALAAGSAVTSLASKVHHTTAVLNGHLDPEGDPGVTECRFEWGTTVAYGNTAPCSEGNAFGAPADVSASLSGLSPVTTYHFRLHIETTSNGPLNGADQSFRTIPVPTEHPLIASFGQDGTSGSSFGGSFPFATPAINQAARKLYVSSHSPSGSNTQLYAFNAAAPPAFPPLAGFPLKTLGTDDRFPQIAVDNTGLGSAGNVYFATVDQSVTPNKYGLNGIDSSGAVLPGFPIAPGTPIAGVAVNPAGEIWAVNSFPDPGKILKYSSAGVFLGSFDLSIPKGEGAAHRIAFDSDGNLYVALYTANFEAIWKFTAASGYTSGTELPDPPASIWSFAFDSSTGYLYASAFSSKVVVYDVASGKLIDEFESGKENTGIAVDATNHAVYLGTGNKVNVYATGAALTPPTVTTAPASAITGSKATLEGFVDPEGQAVSECKFEYLGEHDGARPYAHTVPCTSNPGSGSGDVRVSADLSGLTPNATYHYRLVAADASAGANGEDEAFTTNPPPVVSSPAVENLTYNSADLKALLNPKGYETTYHFEYGTTIAYGTKVPAPDANAGAGTSDVPISASLAGLVPDTLYHWRVVAESINGTVTMPDATFATLGPAKAETMGSPIRTATTAQLQGRVDPDGASTTYRFEYGTEGPCDANPCTSLPDRSAGSGSVYEFVAEPIEGLAPNTTYHYRVVAESPTPGSPGIGADMTVTTRASDAPLSHGRFPGPAGSDRAYEQVSLPDTGGNPVNWAFAVSDDGNRAFYKVSGGTPLSVSGSILTPLFAERSETAPHQGSWVTENIYPPRQQLVGSVWLEPGGRQDLSDEVAQNVSTTSRRTAIWRLGPGQSPVKILEPASADFAGPVVVSDDASRVLAMLSGPQDPAHTPPNNEPNLYDITSGGPRLVGLMPDGSVSTCGVRIFGSSANNVRRATHWVSPDGSLVFFQVQGCNSGGVYLRDLVAEETKLIGREAQLIKSTPGAAFFTTNQSLDPADTGGSDLYRYDIGDESLKCITCIVAGLSANVDGLHVAVSEDGSRVYFSSSAEFIRGAATPGIYRVSVASGDLAYVAPGGGTQLGDIPNVGEAITPDGSALMFTADNAGLNALGGQQNGGTKQFYRYDDRDRSLTCISCPQDGSAPTSSVAAAMAGGGAADEGSGANRIALSANGDIFAFATPNALLPADQNTARPGQSSSVGTDVYEWRDGRLLLVTDGLTNWPDGGPGVTAVNPSGNDIFFTAAAQYTQDALDGYSRLYDARIGGGFEVPPVPKPCPLEVCQGTPKGAPEEQAPGTGNFSGPGNAQARAHHKQKKRHHKKKSHKKQSRHAKHDRRAQR